jgi:Ca2+-binding RTX toxin-like protein
VTNDGDVDLSNVTISDDVFNLDGLEGDTIAGDGLYTLDFLAAGDSVIITYPGLLNALGGLASAADVSQPETSIELDIWQPGQHTNIATVTGSYTDGLGNQATPTDSDAANYDGQALPEVTDAAWCKIYVTKNSFKPNESPDLVVALNNFFEDVDDGFEGLNLTLQVTQGADYFEFTPEITESGELLFDFNWKNGGLFEGEAVVTVTATDPDGHSVDYVLPIEFWGNGDNKQGSDQVFEGMDCNEYFHGGRGKDTIYGNGGDDILNGGGGQDTLIGGEGSDIFVFAPLASYDGSGKGKGATVMDFEDGVDFIGLTDGLTYDGISVQQDGNNVEIYETFSKGSNNLIGTILNANVSQFDVSDFQVVAY